MGDKGIQHHVLYGHVLTFLQSLLPLLVVLMTNGVLYKIASLPTYNTHDDAAKEPSDASDPQSHKTSSLFLLLITGSATAVLIVYAVPATVVLGLCSAIFTAVGIVLFERATRGVEDDATSGMHDSMSSTATQTGRARSSRISTTSQLSALRDIAAIVAFTCGLASVLTEPSIYNIYREPPSRKHQQHWSKGHDSMILQQITWMVPVNVITDALMFILVSFISSQLLSNQTCSLRTLTNMSVIVSDLTFRSFLSKELYIPPSTSYLHLYSPKYTSHPLLQV
jgi:hypothetical protein